MAQTSCALPVLQPLLNSIPEDLVDKFDKQYVELYNKHNVGRPNTHQVPLEAYRVDPSKYVISYGRQDVASDSLRVTEHSCPVEDDEIKVRVCEPRATSSGPRPCYVNFHGGGCVFGNLETAHNFCKRVAIELNCVTIDVDYRLAPEYPFPIPVNDSWAALQWIRNKKATEFNLDLNRLAVGGCSAGGHIAAVLAHMCRDAGIPLAFQMLAVLVMDLHSFSPTGELREDCPYESYRTLANTVPLSRDRMAWFHNHFVGCPRPRELDNDWKVSPIRAANFGGLAPAMTVTAEMDALRDEGEAYGRKMNDAGSKAEVIRVKGAPHSFSTIDEALDIEKQYNRDALRGLGSAFGVVAKSFQ